MADQTSKTVHIREGDALIVVDVQNDFVPGGTLAVPEGDQVIDPLNRAIRVFQARSIPIFLTRDWHPGNHSSFSASGGPWPPHCVQDTRGAQFVSGLTVDADTTIITKGDVVEPDQYSGFQGVDDSGETLDTCLKNRGITRLFIGGLATDYCVLNTVMDGLKLGYEVYLLTDGIRAVNIRPFDGERAIEQMKDNGATLTTTRAFGA